MWPFHVPEFRELVQVEQDITMEQGRGEPSGLSLPVTRVKAIAQQDDSIGKISTEALSIIARSTEAFLADLVKASVVRAGAAGGREQKRKGHSSPPASKPILIQDVRDAAAEEDRFDFLQPVLLSSSNNNSVASTGKRKRSHTTSSSSSSRSKGKARSTSKHEDNGLTAAAPGSALLGMGHGSSVLALAGLPEDSRRALLVAGEDIQGSDSIRGIRDEDEDYDDC